MIIPLPYLNKCLYPYFDSKVDYIIRSKCKFAHYTKIDRACSIIKTKELWMANAREMVSDSKELSFGIQTLYAASLLPNGKYFEKTLSSIEPNLPTCIRETTELVKQAIFEHVYIFCVTEHMPQEDFVGRKDMWEDFNGNDVAIVFNQNAFFDNQANNFVGTCIGYFSDANELSLQLKIISDNIEHNMLNIRQEKKNIDLASYLASATTLISNAIICAVFSIKRADEEKYKHEKEWRVVYVPETEVLLGIKTKNERPKIYMQDNAIQGMRNMNPDKIIDHIIVKKEEYRQEILSAMQDDAYANIRNKIFLSKNID